MGRKTRRICQFTFSFPFCTELCYVMVTNSTDSKDDEGRGRDVHDCFSVVVLVVVAALSG